MVTINCAYTEAINPPGSSPTLTRSQVWKGLQRKIRHAQDFVPVIENTEVLEEKENEVTRLAYFKGKKEGVKEVCKSYYPVKVEFWQESGACITNTISDGPGMGEEEMNMTYTFEWRHEDVAEGSEEHEKLIKQDREGAKMAVSKSIEAMRRMAKAGELD